MSLHQPPEFLPTPGKPAIPWTQWHRLFKNYLLASGSDAHPPARRKALLLHCLGVEGQRLYYALPEEKSSTPPTEGKQGSGTSDEYDAAVATLDAYFTSKTNVVVERHRFGQRTQLPGETATAFVTALRELALSCDFETLSTACKTHACLAYAARILLSINESVNPCKSFTRFVCDGWQKRNEHDVWESQFLSMLDKVTMALNNIDVPESGQNQEQRAAIIYRSCADVLEGKGDELSVVKAALLEGGIVWPQPSKDADVLYTLLHSSLKLGWDVLLDVDVEPSGGAITLFPGQFLRFVLAKHARLETTKKSEDYFEFLKKRFQREGTLTVTYEENQALVEPALSELFLAHNKISGEQIYVDIFLNASDVGLTEDRWTAALQRLNITLAPSLLQTTTTPYYLETLLSLWRQNSSDSFHTLVSWCTIQVAALFANKDLIFNYYDQDYRTAHIYHKIFCLAKAMFFSMRAPFEQYNADVLQGNALAVAKRLAMSVINSYFRLLSNWTSFDVNITGIRTGRLHERVFRNFEQHIKEDDIPIRGQLPDMTDSFVWNWQQSVHMKRVPEIDGAVHAIYSLRYFIVSFKDQDFQLMPYSLSYPLFDSQLPSSVNYGGLGAEIARALGGLFLHLNSENSSQVQPAIDCIKAGPFSDIHSIEEVLTEVLGYEVLADAYKMEDPALDNTVLGLEKYSGVQLFFIALCYIGCDGSSGGIDGEAVCDLPLQNVPEFAKAFNCKPGDPMNPTRKCQLL
ncbi:hypothetical protein V5799_013046 [Amblyomma americanum]|uniref:Peptidase M13 C-terminal domain-containing protein n=1 Tax=Amblyomma americanum TaxID=6943 RepID=A0AAQ4E6Z9_AMBAM